jgi:hypothetical protein
VPKKIRQEAHSILRHFPAEYEMKRASEKAHDVFQERMEPLTLFVLQYEQDKNHES